MSLPGKPKQAPLYVLGLSAGLSLLIYWLWFVRPINLLERYSQIHLDGSYVHYDQPEHQARLIIAFVLLAGLYIWGWQAARKAQGRLAWAIVIGGALACAITLLFLAPFDADDIYDYIMHGRILGLYGANPFVRVGSNFPNDPFVPYMAWKNSPAAYGPVWELMSGVTAKLAGNGIAANVIAFKLLTGGFWLASLGVAAAFLAQVAPQQALVGVFLLAFNPLLLYSTWGNGHNDMVMVFWILLAAWAMAKRHFTIAILALLAGALIKYIPILLLPAAGMIALDEIKGMPRRLGFVVFTFLAGLVLITLAYRPLWIGLDTLTIERRTHLFTSSIPSMLYRLLIPKLGDPRSAAFISAWAASMTAVFALWRGYLAFSENHERNENHSSDWLCCSSFPEASFDILAFYLLITCLWFQQWYAIWLIGIAAILPSGYRQRFAIFFSLAVLSKQLIIGPYMYQPTYRYRQPKFEVLFTLGVLGLPWLYWLAARSAPERMQSYQRERSSEAATTRGP